MVVFGGFASGELIQLINSFSRVILHFNESSHNYFGKEKTD
jgi:hypothetical protein